MEWHAIWHVGSSNSSSLTGHNISATDVNLLPPWAYVFSSPLGKQLPSPILDHQNSSPAALRRLCVRLRLQASMESHVVGHLSSLWSWIEDGWRPGAIHDWRNVRPRIVAGEIGESYPSIPSPSCMSFDTSIQWTSHWHMWRVRYRPLRSLSI